MAGGWGGSGKRELRWGGAPRILYATDRKMITPAPTPQVDRPRYRYGLQGDDQLGTLRRDGTGVATHTHRSSQAMWYG